jgi:dihydropteroate synthase
VEAATEIARVRPVIAALAGTVAVPISVDTTKAEVAAAALAAGATIVNDVSAGTADPEMLGVVAASGAGYVAMHMQGEPRTMQADPHYDDVVREVGEFLVARLDAARAAGVADDALMADPGIGFGKTSEHNLELLASLPELIAAVGVPVLVGTSRKAFLGRIVDEPDPAARDDATLATVVWALERGAAMVRVHDVRAAVQAAAVLGAMARASVARREMVETR